MLEEELVRVGAYLDGLCLVSHVWCVVLGRSFLSRSYVFWDETAILSVARTELRLRHLGLIKWSLLLSVGSKHATLRRNRPFFGSLTCPRPSLSNFFVVYHRVRCVISLFYVLAPGKSLAAKCFLEMGNPLLQLLSPIHQLAVLLF